MSDVCLLKHRKRQTRKIMSRCESHDKCKVQPSKVEFDMSGAHCVGTEDIHHHHTQVSRFGFGTVCQNKASSDVVPDWQNS